MRTPTRRLFMFTVACTRPISPRLENVRTSVMAPTATRSSVWCLHSLIFCAHSYPPCVTSMSVNRWKITFVSGAVSTSTRVVKRFTLYGVRVGLVFTSADCHVNVQERSCFKIHRRKSQRLSRISAVHNGACEASTTHSAMRLIDSRTRSRWSSPNPPRGYTVSTTFSAY